jgi:nucleoside 2-deoxyribosyltransferase
MTDQEEDNSILKCFLCANKPEAIKYDMGTSAYNVRCGLCGFYALGEFAKVSLDRDPSNEKRYALAWIVRDLSPAQKQPITADALDDLVRESLAREPTPSGKAQLLLHEIKRRSRALGFGVNFDPAREWPMMKARGLHECQAIIAALRRRCLLAEPRHLNDDQLILEWEGWEMIEPLTGSAARTVFVAMAFRPDLDKPYEQAIKRAIEKVGLTPVRLDKEAFPEKICERILMEIHSSEFVVADFTHQRGGVYFEAGYALALRKSIIWLCREDDVENLHFDTRQYQHIVWSTEVDLAARLEERLRYLLLQKEAPGGVRSKLIGL